MTIPAPPLHQSVDWASQPGTPATATFTYKDDPRDEPRDEPTVSVGVDVAER